MNGANQTGSVLLTKNWTAAAGLRLNVGDVFTIFGVNQVNPQSRQSTGVLQPFVVTAAAYSDAGGLSSISISPPIIPAGAFQTVDATAADAAPINVWGFPIASQPAGLPNSQTPQGLAFHKDALTLACAPMPIPNNAEMASRSTDPDLGISLRFIRTYDSTLDRFVSRMDILFGVATLRPETAIRISMG